MIKIVLTLLLAASAGNALAANINIGPNGCTLADAIRSANTNSAVGNCASGSGSDFIIAPDGWVVTLNSALPTITSNLTIRSASSAGIFTIDGNDHHRVLKITGQNTNVTLLRVEIRNGKTSLVQSGGAGIRIENATVRLEKSSVVSNDSSAVYDGAGIYVTDGILTLDHSSVKSNYDRGVTARESTVHVVDSTFSRNLKAGLAVWGGNLLVERSLIDEWGIGINGIATSAEIVNTTFAPAPKVEWRRGKSLYFTDSSFVSLNHVTMRTFLYFEWSILSVSNSLLADCENFRGNVALNSGNLFHSDSAGNYDNCLGLSPHDYSLLPLADNGGPTMTHAIGDPSSAAIGAGHPAYCATVDQRGEARGAVCDVGAYEATGFADLAVTAHIDPGAPYVSEQHIVAIAEIENKGPGIATNVRFNVNVDNAFVSSVNSVFCNTNPCVITSIQPGQTMEIPIELHLYNYLSSQFSMDLSAHTTATSTYVDGNEDDSAGNNFFSLTHAINPGADLALTMDLYTAGPYYVGQTIQYQARIDNAGPQTASGIQLQFAPEHLDNVVFSGCASTSGLTCNVSNIASGNSRTVGIQARITDVQFNAAGSVSATQVDINPGDNIDDRNNGGGVTESNITVKAKILDSGPYYSYDYLEIAILISTGNEPASNIRVHYDFPGSEFINIQPCAYYPCIIPQLAANSEITLLAQFFAPIAIPGVVETLDFHVEAWPGQTDSQPLNNEVTITKDLYPVADVGSNLSLISTPPFYAGQQIQYALQVFNAGFNAANSLRVKVIPENLTLLSSYGDLCPTVPCMISRLNALEQGNITLIYRIDEAGAFDLSASVHATEHDNVPGNNTDSSNNGGTALEPPIGDRIFADDFE